MPDTTEYHAPHCDENVLHRQSICWACDMYPDRQAARERDGINFTGENDPAKSQCPAESRRTVGAINRWHGNVAQTKEEADAYWAEYQKALDGFIALGHPDAEEKQHP